jgi:transposase
MEQHSPKLLALRQQGVLNSKPTAVLDPLFRDSDFFDPHDAILVKYEMLRRVRVDGTSIVDSAKQFGFSRIAYYQVLRAYQSKGMPGLLPKKRGPKHRHKCSAAVMEKIAEIRQSDPDCSSAQLATNLKKRLGITIHQRSIERAIQALAKKGRHRSADP